MALAPGTTSGTYNGNFSNAKVVFEAFDRIGIRAPSLTRHHMLSARDSLFLELESWSTKGGPNLWKVIDGTINLQAGVGTYQLPTSLITLTEVWYSIVDGIAPGVNSDRIMIPINRSQYAMISNKLQQGTPTQFWFERLQVPEVTLWQVPQSGQVAPNYIVQWFGLRQIQDANLATGEVPDVVYRSLDALCACMAERLAEKFAPDRLAVMEQRAAKAWAQFATDDQEMGPVTMQPNLSGYGRI